MDLIAPQTKLRVDPASDLAPAGPAIT